MFKKVRPLPTLISNVATAQNAIGANWVGYEFDPIAKPVKNIPTSRYELCDAQLFDVDIDNDAELLVFTPRPEKVYYANNASWVKVA